MRRIVRLKDKASRSAQKGFTLIELIVVLALMSILLSISIFGALGWIDWVQFQKEDETAEDIFFAAQNQLTELDSSGALQRKVIDVLWDESANNYKSDYILAQGTDKENLTGGLDDFIKTNGETYDWDKVWLDKNLQLERRTILGIRVAQNRYDSYLNQNTRKNMTAEEVLVFDLIAPYISDRDVLNGSIAIEFSPEAGQIFAVCFSDRAKAFTYTAETNADAVNIKDRTLQTREGTMVGYYGVDTLTNKISGRAKNNDEYRLEIENGNALVLILHPMDITKPISNATLEFTIQGSNVYNPQDGSSYHDVMTFTVNSKDVDDTRATSLQAAASDPVSVDVTLKEGLFKDSSKKTFRIPMWKENINGDDCICMALDAVDIQAQTISYADMFGLTTETDELKKNAFTNTFSFYRFGLTNVRFIRAKVKVTMAGANGSTEAGRKAGSTELFSKYSDQEGALHGAAVTFADYDEQNDSDDTYGISNGRHLYNIRYESDYSDELKKAGHVNSERKRVYTLKTDIDWKRDFTGNGDPKNNYFLDSYNTKGLSTEKYGINLDLSLSGSVSVNRPELGYIKYTKEGEVWSSELAYPEDTSTMPFPGFRMLSNSDQFVGMVNQTGAEQGNNTDASSEETNSETAVQTVNAARISNLIITLSGNCIYGVYGKTVQGLIENHSYSEISSDGKAGLYPLGLFAESWGTIKDIELDQIKVSGVEGFSVNNPTNFLFTSKVGGFVGENFGELQNLSIDVFETTKSGNTPPDTGSHIRGRMDVGGIVGHQYYMVDQKDANGNSVSPKPTNDKPYADASQTISGCRNNATVTGIGYVGGIIGRIYPSGNGTNESDGKTAFDLAYNTSNYADNYINSTGSKKNIKQFIIEDCENHGEVSMDSLYAENVIDTNTLRRGFYFGGITGAAFFGYSIDKNDSSSYTFGKPKSKRAVIKNCISAKEYTKDELLSIINPTMTNQEEVQNAERLLRMNFVGGIVGGARYATIDSCSTTLDKSDNYAFVFGDRYVGGVAGYSVESEFFGGEAYTTAELAKLKDGGQGCRSNYAIINGTGVFGNYAIGGIAGAFGRPRGADGRDIVKANLELGYGDYESAVADIRFPVGISPVDGKKHQINGLLNTALVLGYSFNGKINKTTTYNKTEQSYYGVGGIVGLLATTIADADYIQTEETKQLYLQLITEGVSLSENMSLSEPSDLNDISFDDLTTLVNTTQFVTDGTGGIAGMAICMGNINVALGGGDSNRFSRIDAIVFGRNRVGGVIGDTEADPDRGSQSAIDGGYPYKASDSSSGLYVIGYENVGGIAGVFGENGSSGSYPALNQKNNRGSITNPYHVIGYRAVGGAVGTFARDNGNNQTHKTSYIKIEFPGATEFVRGSMYVGGVVGIQEGYLKKDGGTNNPNRYHVTLKKATIKAECFAGGYAGAVFSDTKYALLDKLVNLSNRNSLNTVTVEADMCAGLLMGIYAADNFEIGKKSVLSYAATDSVNDIYKPGDGISKNGLNNISIINNLKYDSERTKTEDARLLHFTGLIKSQFIASIAETETTIMDMYDFGETVLNSGGSTNIVEAGIFVGGMAGFVPDHTRITVSNFRNRAKLFATNAIQSAEAAVALGRNDENWYSYLGVVTGRIPLDMTAIRPINGSSSQPDENNYHASEKTSFVGGVAEINAGTIVGSGLNKDGNAVFTDALFRTQKDDFHYANLSGAIGGIVGLNGTRYNSGDNVAVVRDCKNIVRVRGKSASGIVAAVGGDSMISGCVNFGTVQAVGADDSDGAAGILYKRLDIIPDASSLIITDCVNTGLITVNNEYSSTKAAGISYDMHGKGEIKLCRNYALGLKYAICSGTAGMQPRSVQYCLDASDTTEKSGNGSGFGMDLTNSNNKANLYIGRKTSDPVLGLPSASDYYNVDWLYQSEEEHSVDNSLVLTSGQNPDTKVDIHPLEDENGNKLEYTIRSVDQYGNRGNSFSDINTLSIYWDNSTKTALDEYYSLAEDLKLDESARSAYYADFVGEDGTSCLDFAVRILNEGSDTDEDDYNDRYYVANQSSYDKDVFTIDRDSFLSYSPVEGVVSAYEYIYATYVYMRELPDCPSVFADMADLYCDLLSNNIQNYGIKQFFDDEWIYTLNYRIILTDIKGKEFTSDIRQIEIDKSKLYILDSVNIESMKNDSIDFDKISCVTVAIESKSGTYSDDTVGIRGLSWTGASPEKLRYESLTGDNPYKKATSIENTIDVLDTYGYALSTLYFVKETDTLPKLYLFGYYSEIGDISLANDKPLLNDDDPVYFANKYLVDKTQINKGNKNNYVTIQRNSFYQSIDAKYKELMSSVYTPQ